MCAIRKEESKVKEELRLWAYTLLVSAIMLGLGLLTQLFNSVM